MKVDSGLLNSGRAVRMWREEDVNLSFCCSGVGLHPLGLCGGELCQIRGKAVLGYFPPL